jgi:hypothetical protein
MIKEMKENPASQSGIFNRRIIIAVALCSLGASLGWLSFAATPKTAASQVSPNSGVSVAAPTNPACTLPGVTVVTDTGTNDAADMQANHDIISASVSYPFVSATDPDKLFFSIKVASLSTLTPNTFYFVSFTIDGAAAAAGTVHGVRMVVGSTGTPTFESYLAGASNAGTVDGRFVSGTPTPAESGSTFDTNGTITIIVKPSNIGVTGAGHSLTNWDGAVAATAGGLVTGILDWMPTGDATTNPTRGGISFTVQSNQTCNPNAGTNPPRFFTYLSPQGVGDSAGEPSIGSNWTKEAINHNHHVDGSPDNNIPNGGTSLYFGGFLSAMVKVTWDDCSSPAGTLWQNKPLIAASSPHLFGDPILFTDHTTGRTFVGQLEGLTPAGSAIDITDNDGDSFIPSDGVIPSDIDHETIGGGPYHSPLSGTVYPNAIYYASQSVAEARAFRSDNGGFLFSQAAAPMFAITDCAGLHGHIKVSPADGTVYVPDKGCGGTLPFHEASKQAVIRSDDNGLTWTVLPVSTSTGNGEEDNPADGSHQTKSDPSVGVAIDGTLYFGYQANDGHPHIAVSTDKGATWGKDTDVGAIVVNGGPVLNTTFPAVVAGDSGRAAFAFFGSETGGTNFHCGNGEDCSPAPPFPGVWYLYVATTFDGGTTWFTQNVTPGDPIQRGGICNGGTCRNLLDFFDATIDKEGRIVIGYDDGCISASCINGGANDFTAKAAIARQSGGRRMFSAFDPVEPALPGAPAVTGGRNVAGDTATLSWPAPDNSGSPITGYNIYRKTGGGGAPYNLIATVPVTNYTDATLVPAVQYCYHVTAVNGIGEGPYCPDFCPIVVPGPNICLKPGLPPGALVLDDLNPDGTDNDSGANTPPDPRVNIRELYIAEPCFGPGVQKLVFTMQLAPSPTLTSPPSSSQWYIVWQRPVPDADFDRWFVGMKTDATGALSFVYGKFGVPLDATNPNPNANTPVVVGDADSGTYNVATGVVTIVLDNSKAENVTAGGSLPNINIRTYFARPDAGQKSQNNASDITGNSTYTLSGNASCCQPVPLLGIVSRKTHTNVGPFDVNLIVPPVPAPGIGIECRKGQGTNSDQHQMVFTFANPLLSVAGASVTGGTGSIVGGHGNIANTFEYVVDLTGVTNAQQLTVTVTGITDTAGNSTPTLAGTMGVLLGDTSANRLVNSTDISQTQAQSGKAVTGSNFRTDVTVNGLINSTDISTVQSKSGTGF